MKQRILIALLILIAITGAGLFADTIDLEGARVLALANSRSLAKINLQLANSALDEKSQLYSMLPQVSAEYNASASYLNNEWAFVNPLDTFTSGISLSVRQTIFNGGRSFVQKAIAAMASESARKAALAEYFSVIDAADNACYAVLEAAATVEAEEAALASASASLEIAEIRQASGMINPGDYLKALAEKESRENSRNQARRNLALATAEFKSLLGIEQNAALDLAPVDFSGYEELMLRLANIADNDVAALYERLWTIAAQSNISLSQSALNTRRAEKNLSLAKREYFPTVSATVFTAGIGYSAAAGVTNTSGGGITLSGTIPLDFWVAANNIKKSKNALDSSVLDYSGAEAQLKTELQSALLNAFADAGSVLSSRRSLEYAEKHFEYVAERYRLSQASVSDYGEASLLEINSRNSYIRASYAFLQSLSKLRLLSAMDDEAELRNILMGN